ncbi:hypothetical protein FQN54_004146 [Arachnomyces sp. PD_36]|nr:hypothetical protein FQN54_004146 [Arachnomyces sp. PD_36]
MSKIRGLVPVLLATGLGVLNGYVIFKPAYQDLENKKLEKLQESQSTELGPDLKPVPIPGADIPSTPTSSTLDGQPPQTWTRKIHGWYTGATSTPTAPSPTTANKQNDETKDN